MKRLLVLLTILYCQAAIAQGYTIKTDSVYLFSYTTVKNGNHNGLHFSWSSDREKWYDIGNEYGYLKCDYGRWGTEKRMITPYLLLDSGNTWHCIWTLNDRVLAFAHAASADLIDWGRQSYPEVKAGQNVLSPVVSYESKLKSYNIVYTDKNNKYYKVVTRDFKVFSKAHEVSQDGYKNLRETINLPSGKAEGQVFKVPMTVVDKLVKTWELKQYKNALYSESVKQDSQRFAGLKPVNVTISIEPQKVKPISNMLLGIFFEDINYAADGGLYAELIQNRDFEYALTDKEGKDLNWNSIYSWMLKGDNTQFKIDSVSPLHANNPHYAVLETKEPGASLINTGFNGITVKEGAKYNLSLFTRVLSGNNSKLLVRLVNKKGKSLAQVILEITKGTWENSKAVLTAGSDANDASLELQPLNAGSLAIDMVSLFPRDTYKGRKNGLRADLAQTVADIHPRFVRFPGGCVAHGDGLKNIYRWKNTIGPLEARKPQRNLWGYHQTAGLGYLEYFQFCEDIGAEPVPVIAAGVPCQNSATGGDGQQGGIPINEMSAYIQDIFDLVEWANGGVDTRWGRIRAEAGHPEPFGLKYIGIGNEDLISDVFEERFTMIFNAVKKKHPEITVIGTVGPANEGTDYREGWQIASKLRVPMVDEHYYQSTGWFIHNQDFYDQYDRSKSKVYLGEYASWGSALYNALAEALYLTSLERNGDIVSMASYAPLLGKEGSTQWNPDLIYFNNNEIKLTVNYEVQKLYGLNGGAEYFPALVNSSNNQDAVNKRIACSVVRDTQSKDVIVKLVNLLPVSVTSSVDLTGLITGKAVAVKTVLTGEPSDKNARPVESKVEVMETLNAVLPAYSFTVFRIKAK